MAESAEIIGDDVSITGKLSEDSVFDEVTATFVKNVLCQSSLAILKDLKPDDVLDVFTEEEVFGENTVTQVRDIKEQKTTTEKNRQIYDTFRSKPDLYVGLKRGLVRSGQTGLLEKIEETEKKVHPQQTGDLHGCSCSDGGSSCTFLDRLKCPTDLPSVESSLQKVPATFVTNVLHQSHRVILNELKPDDVLDVFEEEKLFGEDTIIQVRDIKEIKNTTEKNRQIYDTIRSRPNLYIGLKRALVRSGQIELLEKIEKTEKEEHKQHTGDLHGCSCSDGGSSCRFLERLICPRDLPSKESSLPPEEARLQKNLRKILLDQYKDDAVRIPIYLLKPGEKHPVQYLYVKQHMRRADPRGKPEHQQKPRTEDKPIENVTDILFKDGEVCKDVFISAEAGMGKSSLCAHLVRLWCDAHSAPEKGSGDQTTPGGGIVSVASNNASIEHDLNALKKFTLLFYINLRDVDKDCLSKNSKNDEISVLIQTQNELSDFEDLYSLKYLRQCLLEPSTLVIMDSLDEFQLARLPYRGKNYKCCIVTTSRPWKLAALRSELDKKHDHQQVEIVGLEESSPEYLVENVVKVLNKDKDQEKYGSDFLTKMKEEGLDEFLKIPMLILQMLILWYDGESFGKSQSEIYSKVVHHQILTAIKNKDLPKIEGGICEQEFPMTCCTKKSCDCKKYCDLLWKVASLANNTLFNENRAMCLEFDQTVDSDLTEDEVHVCLKIGILSQQKLFSKQIRKEKTSISFPHKTNQEYFSSIHLSHRWSEKVKNQIFSVINDLDRALELDKVLLFCNELNPVVACELFRLIFVRADDDARVQEYRQSGENDDAPNIDLIYKIQNIVSAAQQKNTKISSPHPNPSSQQSAEASVSIPETRSGSTPRLIMADVILCKPSWRRTEEDRSVNVAALDMAEIKSLHADAETTDVTIWKMLEKETRSLQTLVFKGNKINVELIHGVVVRNKANLQTLGLHGADSRSHLDLSPLGNKLTDMFTPHLTCLLLRLVDLSHEQCEMLGRHLSTTGNIRRLTLSCIFSHEQCETLVRHLSATQNLQQLSLEWIECQTHGEVSGECCDVKLQSRLEHVKLCVLPFRMITFHTEDLKTCEIWLEDNIPAATSALSCLTSASNLREFRCESLGDVASVRELVSVLPRLHGLQRIVLRYIDYGSLREIRLSAAAETLEDVLLRDSNITADGLESLVQSVNARRVRIMLYDVTITDRDPRDFLQRLRDSPDTEVTEDKGVEYEDGSRWTAAGWWVAAGWRVEMFWFYKNKQQTS